jgi:hypothetical protein
MEDVAILMVTVDGTFTGVGRHGCGGVEGGWKATT